MAQCPTRAIYRPLIAASPGRTSGADGCPLTVALVHERGKSKRESPRAGHSPVLPECLRAANRVRDRHPIDRAP